MPLPFSLFSILSIALVTNLGTTQLSRFSKDLRLSPKTGSDLIMPKIEIKVSI